MASLRDLGLSEYEARVYRALLETGPTTAKELSRASDVPMGRIYDVLNGIEGSGLVRSQSASRPKKYVAVEPETALDRLLEDRRRELEARVEQYERVVDELSGELETTEPVEETFWTAAVGPEETVDLLVERLAAADERIALVLSTHRQGLYDVGEVGDRMLDGVAAALERGVAVRLLMRPDLVPALPERIGERYRETFAGHDRFEVRTSEEVTGTFNLIDGTETVIEVPHPLEAEGVFAMIDLKDREFAASVAAEFEPRWERADPLEF
jgi:sugar-specific transcriptional regulator TrmB